MNTDEEILKAATERLCEPCTTATQDMPQLWG